MTYRSKGLLAVVAALMSVLLAGWAAAAEDGHDHGDHDHGDHASSLGHDSRFTAPGGVWPPQPKGATEVVTHGAGFLAPEPPAVRMAALDAATTAGPTPSEVAAADPEVSAALGDRTNLIAAWDDGGDTVLLHYSLSNNQTVEIRVTGDGAITIDRREPTQWQPPLSEVEKAAAADVARSYWEDQGNTRVEELEGYSILAMSPDGTYFDTRMVYVSFHATVDDRPELINWVDLVAGEVVQAEVEDLSAFAELDATDQVAPFESAATPFQGATAADASADLVVSGNSLSFGGWDFEASVESGLFDGMSLRDVSYRGVPVFRRVSFPAMIVYYDALCGPYVDRVGGPFYQAEGPTEFTLDGVRWVQLGITDYIGNYVITQMFYFSENGQFDFHVFSKGLQCNIRHDHYPFLRLDTELGDPGGDVIHRALPGGTSQAMTTEFSLRASEAVDHGWEVRDPQSGYVLTVDFDDNNPGLGNDPVVPISSYQNNFVYGRQYVFGEELWQGDASLDLYGGNGQTISDAVLGYRGYMPHSPAEGPNLWHSTGIRTTVVAPASTGTGTIAGTVTTSAGGPAAGLQVDRFTDARAQYLDSTSTASDGTFRFDAAPGCYVLTFVAPGDGSTLVGGGRYLDRPVCVTAGQTTGGADAVLVAPGPNAGAVGGNVRFDNGSPAVGLKADLFTAGRASFLNLTETDTNGAYRFDLASAQCGVVTLIAPNGFVFSQTRGQYLNLDFCAAAGQELLNLDAVLVRPNTNAALGGGVADGFGPTAGAKAVVYRAGADGARAGYIAEAFTGPSGLWALDVEPGCYVIDLEAPAGRTWRASGGRYLQRSSCVQSGDFNSAIGGLLN